MEKIAMHRTFENRKLTIYITNDGINVQKLEKFPFVLPANVRVTAASSSDEFLIILAKFHTILYAHFHSTGVEAGLKEEDLVKEWWNLPDSLFKQFRPRPDLSELRRVLKARNSINQFYQDSRRVLLQLQRNLVNDAIELPDEITQEIVKNSNDVEMLRTNTSLKLLDEVRKFDEFKTPSTKSNKLVSLDTELANVASKIQECQFFNRIAGIKNGWIWAAEIGCCDVMRFPFPGSWEHYCGLHTEDGRAPKRKSGAPTGYNPSIPVINHANFVCNICMNKSNPWNPIFTNIKEVYKVKYPDRSAAHCVKMAMRTVLQEIFKQYYFACHGIEYDSKKAGKFFRPSSDEKATTT